MPFRTEHGSHYHETYGCHGATIPCSAGGLSPCSDCCGNVRDDTPSRGASDPPAAPAADGAPMPSSPSSPTPEGSHRQRRRRMPPNDAGCVYVGYFLEPDQLSALLDGLDSQGFGGRRLRREIGCPHVTLGYMPQDAHEDLFGETRSMTVVGYGNDGRNEGVEIVLGNDANDTLIELGRSVPLPHVTLSVSEDGRPVDTRDIEFQPLDEPIELTGRFGGYTTGNEVVFANPLDVPDAPAPVPPAGDGSARPSAVSLADALAPMSNPSIPPDGLVEDVAALAAEVKDSNGLVAVMRGSAGCGKSTLMSLLGDGTTVVCPDDIRLALFGVEPDENGKLGIPQREGGRVWGIARRQAAKACARPGSPVVIDAMHTRPRDVRQWQDLADRTGRRLVVVDLTDVPREESKARNAGRPEWKQVPESVIDRFYDLAERNTSEMRRQFSCVSRGGFAELAGLLGFGGKTTPGTSPDVPA